MSQRLLDRQVSLLRYLTSEEAVFGSGRVRTDALVEGFDEAHLRLEARFSFNKRMSKIRNTCPRTFELLGEAEDEVVREFVATRPPNKVSRLENALQFRSFLDAWWRRHPRDPTYLQDVLACEIAMAQVNSRMPALEPSPVPPSAVRRRPGTVLLRCEHDVRPVFEGERERHRVVRRETLLAAARASGSGAATIIELPPAVHALVESIETWIPLAAFDAPGIQALIAGLVERGVLETGP